MKLGFYKPYKKTCFDFNSDDNNYGGSQENVNLMKIFAEHGHEFYIFSKTDYQENIPNIYIGNINDIPKLDYIFISNGVFEKDQFTEEEITNKFRKYCDQIVLLETDLSLSRKYHDINNYDIILSQGPTNEYREYAHLEKLIIYKHKIFKNSWDSRFFDVVFIGTERDRTNKIVEYIMRPNVTWFGKSNTFKINNKVNRLKLAESLTEHFVSIVMSGDEQNSDGFVSQRYFENSLFGCINLIDHEYDNTELNIRHDDWRRVKNYLDVFNKIEELRENEELFNSLQQKQFDELEQWSDGTKIYNHIMSILNFESIRK